MITLEITRGMDTSMIRRIVHRHQEIILLVRIHLIQKAGLDHHLTRQTPFLLRPLIGGTIQFQIPPRARHAHPRDTMTRRLFILVDATRETRDTHRYSAFLKADGAFNRIHFGF